MILLKLLQVRIIGIFADQVVKCSLLNLVIYRLGYIDLLINIA
jgi:hypothetical protein